MTTETTTAPVSLADVLRARRVLARYLPPSPLVEAPVLSEQMSCRVFLKLESLLPTGAFKVRGGIYLLSLLDETERARGIVAATRGNHGQSLAYACRMFKTPCHLFVPCNNSPKKNAAMRRLGARVTEAGRDFNDACKAAFNHALHTGATLVHPGEEPRLIAGVGTWALELREQVPVPLDAVFVPVGVGSCLAGSQLVFPTHFPGTRLIGVAASAAPAFAQSLQAGVIKEVTVQDTIADGLAVRRPPELIFGMLRKKDVELRLVDEPAIREAMRDLVTHEAIVAEGASAATLAAARDYAKEHRGHSIVLLISGRNVDAETLEEVVSLRHRVARDFVAT